MILSNIAWLWATSSVVCEGAGFRLTARRIKFTATALANYRLVRPMLEAPAHSPLGRLIKDRPETVGAVIWPYQSSDWNARDRLGRIVEHYSIIERFGIPVDFAVDEQIVLLDLGDIRNGLSVVLDQPKWFIREGQLTISLFLDDLRLFSLAFSFFKDHEDVAAFVGAIQGRDIDGALDYYRDLTKASYGMRPRDFLLEIFKILCGLLGVKSIYGVADEYRHHRSPYFAKDAVKSHSINYNEVWEERGGSRISPTCYRLNVRSVRKDLETISSKKRSMYRKRYELLDNLEPKMETTLRSIGAPARTLAARRAT